MYDAMSEPREFIADTPAEAIAKACRFFGVEEEALTIRSLDASSVSGLAARVVVVAQPTAAVGAGNRRARTEPAAGGERDRERGRERNRERGRGRRDRAEVRPGRPEDRPERKPEAAPRPEEPSVGTPRGEIGPVGEFLTGLVERMDLGPFEIAMSEDDRYLVYSLTGPAAHALTTDGRVPDALQLLANQAASRLFEEPKRVVVDTEGNRERRESYLARLAERAATRAAETGRAVALEPMNAKDRRGVHVALREAEGIATMSIGEGRYRQVVVVPEGAPEYEEARRYAESAGEG